VDLRKSGREKSAKCTAEGSSTVEETDAVQKLMPAVEHAQIDYHPAEQAALCQPKEKANNEKAMVAFDEAGAERDYTPGK